MDRGIPRRGTCSMRTEIRLSGAGGHGIITASVILAEALAAGGLNVSQTQTYGPEARGGSAFADVVVSDGPIHYPKAMRPDILVTLTQAACDLFSGKVSPDGLLLVDADMVDARPVGKVAEAPIIASVRRDFGGETYAGIAALGVVHSLCRLGETEAFEKAIGSYLPAGALKTNLAVFRMGMELGAEAGKTPPKAPVEADL